jgi:hypothetical protein
VIKVESCTKPQHFCCVAERPDTGSLWRSVRPEPTTRPVKVTMGDTVGKLSMALNIRGAMLRSWWKSVKFRVIKVVIVDSRLIAEVSDNKRRDSVILYIAARV